MINIKGTNQMTGKNLAPNEIDLLNEEAWEINRTEPTRCADLATQALKASEDANYLVGTTHAKAALGACNVWLSNYDLALTYLFDARTLLKQEGNKKKEAEVVYHLFCSFYFLSDYDKAITYAQEMIKLAEANNDATAKANGLNGIGTIYYTLGESQNAINYLQQGVEIAQHLADKHLLARIYDGLGTAYHQISDYDKAITYKQKSLDAAKQSGIRNVEAYALNGLALIYKDKKDFEKSKTLFLQSLEIRKAIQFKTGLTESFYNLGVLELEFGDVENAKSNLLEALALANEIDAKAYTYKIHEALAKYYESKNDLDNFKKHYALFYSSKDAYTVDKYQQQLKSSQMQMRMAQIEQEKELLEKRHQALEAHSKDLVILSDLGKKITTLITIESINLTVYDILNNMMEVHGFGIGIYDKTKNAIVFPGYIEDGNVEPESYDGIDDDGKISSVCFNRDQEILINNFEEEYQQYLAKRSSPAVGKAVSSIIYIPLKIENTKIGVLTVQSFNNNAYNEYHLNLARNLAVYCAIALQNAKAYETLEEKIAERTKEVTQQKEQLLKSYETTYLLSEIGQQLTSTTTFESIFHKLYENVNKLMDAGCFGVRLLKHETNEIEYRFEIEKGKINYEVNRVSLDNDNNYSVWCVKNKEVIFINDNIAEHTKWVKQIHVVTGDMPHSLIFYPLVIGEKVLGVITVQSFERNAYKPHHIDILKTLGTYTAIALENANLIENLEVRVQERTFEVLQQKEQIEKTFANTKLISEIGKEISTTLSVEQIIAKVYESVNALMDANVFGIGVYREQQNDLFFAGVMEKGERLDDYAFHLNEEKIATRCFSNSQEIVINDWEKEFHLYIKEDYAPSIGETPESMIYLPLLSKGKAIGVMTVQSLVKQAYHTYHTDILRSLSVYIGSAIENANLYQNMENRVIERTQEIEKAYQNTKLLNQISKEISASLSIEKLVESVYTHVNSLMDAASFGIGIYNPETNCIHFPGFMEDGKKLENIDFNADDDRLAGWCFRNQKEIFTNNFPQDYHLYVKAIKNTLGGKHSISVIYLPLFSKGKIIGLLTTQSYNQNAYSEYHLDMLRSLSHTISNALENAMLYSSLEDKVRERTIEVVKQKEIIEEKNKHITDSIIYAKRIQQAILPPEEVFCNYLQNSFVLYKPKDIVSGDFYWIERKQNKILFAVVDCTGHGVPGAFMSIIGFNGLNQIVNEYNVTNPAEILNRLNKIITQTLKQKTEESTMRDGMDLSICCIDLDNNKLEFAGANNPIFIVRNNNVLEIIADHHPIGNFIDEAEFSFTNKEIDLFQDDSIYLSSDGYADQFGGPRGKKLKYTQFRDILLNNHQRPMKEQKDILDKMFEEWRGDLEQIDDVCVIGVKIG